SCAKKIAVSAGETAILSGSGGSLDHTSWFGIFRIEFGNLDLFCEADFAEKPDAIVVDVELVPDEAVTRADGMGVVVVVPAFAAGEQRDPPAITGVVLGLEAAVAPEMSGGVHQPGGVETDGDPQE